MLTEKTRSTVHTASRAMYENFIKKLLKTNAVFRISGTICSNSASVTTDELLVHPFMTNASSAAYSFMYKCEAAATKVNGRVLWNVFIHEGSPAAFKLLWLFNRTLTLCKVPETER